MLPDIKLKSGAILRRRTISEIEFTSREALEKRDKRTTGRSSTKLDESFSGTPDMQTFLDMLGKGWSEGLANAKGLDGISSDHHERLNFNARPAGVFPIVPNYLAGNPNAMLRPEIQDADEVRSLTLVVDNCYNYNIRSSAVLEYAQELMAVVAWLIAERIEVSIVALISERINGKTFYWSIPIRDKGTVLQPERIATCVHTSFFRRGWFSMLEHEYHEKKLTGADACRCGYGRSISPELSDLPEILGEDTASIVMLPKASNDGRAKDAIKNAITLKLRHKD